MNVKGIFATSAAALIVAGASCPVTALADGPLLDAFNLTKPILDTRLRYEFVDQEPLAHDADAITWRTRAGFETGKAWGTS